MYLHKINAAFSGIKMESLYNIAFAIVENVNKEMVPPADLTELNRLRTRITLVSDDYLVTDFVSQTYGLWPKLFKATPELSALMLQTFIPHLQFDTTAPYYADLVRIATPGAVHSRYAQQLVLVLRKMAAHCTQVVHLRRGPYKENDEQKYREDYKVTPDINFHSNFCAQSLGLTLKF